MKTCGRLHSCLSDYGSSTTGRLSVFEILFRTDEASPITSVFESPVTRIVNAPDLLLTLVATMILFRMIFLYLKPLMFGIT